MLRSLSRFALRALPAVPIVLMPGLVAAQQPMDPPPLYPPPLPPREDREDRREADQPLARDPRINPESDLPWGLPEDLKRRLAKQAEVYRDYAVRFTCTETKRTAEYNGNGSVSSENVRRYAFLLIRDERGSQFVENRQRLSRLGPPKDTVEDAEPFPPAYAWVFLFATHNHPFFNYRYLGDRFEGFDWVRVIQFRGTLSFTDGKDIREWEGTALVDATTLTPIEIFAQPAGQSEQILARYRNWAKSFSFAGFRFGPKPMAYRSHVQFRMRRDGLTFPTDLRYDTMRAISSDETRAIRASTRSYGDYRFFKPSTEPEVFQDPATN